MILPKSSLRGTLVYGGAIVMSFIGVGFSMFSLSRLQDTSERRTLITEVLKWSTCVRFCIIRFPFSEEVERKIASVCTCVSMAECYVLYFSHRFFFSILFMSLVAKQPWLGLHPADPHFDLCCRPYGSLQVTSGIRNSGSWPQKSHFVPMCDVKKHLLFMWLGQ